MSGSSNYCPSIPLCCQPISGYNYGQAEFLNTAISGSCPTGYAGGPFQVPAANFFSDVSQAAADAKAQAFLQSLITSGCVLSIPVVTNGFLNYGNGVAFSFQIQATYSPTSYGSGTLPSGVSLNTITGVISGTITSGSTTYSIPISATNAYGTGNGTLTLSLSKTLAVVLSIYGGSGGAILDHIEISIDGASFAVATLGSTYIALSKLAWRSISKTGNISGTGDMNVLATLTGSTSVTMNSLSYAKVMGAYTELLDNTWSWSTGVTGSIGSGIQYGPQVSESSTTTSTISNSVVPSGAFSSAINLMQFESLDSYGSTPYMEITTAIVFETSIQFS